MSVQVSNNKNQEPFHSEDPLRSPSAPESGMPGRRINRLSKNEQLNLKSDLSKNLAQSSGPSITNSAIKLVDVVIHFFKKRFSPEYAKGAKNTRHNITIFKKQLNCMKDEGYNRLNLVKTKLFLEGIKENSTSPFLKYEISVMFYGGKIPLDCST